MTLNELLADLESVREEVDGSQPVFFVTDQGESFEVSGAQWRANPIDGICGELLEHDGEYVEVY